MWPSGVENIQLEIHSIYDLDWNYLEICVLCNTFAYVANLLFYRYFTKAFICSSFETISYLKIVTTLNEKKMH